MRAEFILRPAVSLALIAIIGLLAYSNSFTGEFLADDKGYISDNPLIMDPGKMLNPPQDSQLSSNLKNTLRPRIIVMLSFWLNYELGGFNPVGYHIANFLIHMANAALVYLLVLLTLRHPAQKPPNAMRYAPLLCALLFVSHPLQTQAVTYISQRFASLATLFYLVSLLAYIMARGAGWNKKGYALYALCLLSAALGMKSKEIVFTLPVSVALYDYLFPEGDRKTRLMAIAPLFLIAALVPLDHTNMDMSLPDSIETGTRTTTVYARTEYLLTQTRALVTYIRLFFFPVGQSFFYDYPASKFFFEPAVLLSSLFLITILGAGLWLALRGMETSARLAGFGILWFFITISIESSVFPLYYLMFEYRTYLPSAGVWMAFSVGIAALAERLPSRQRMFFTAALVVIIALAGMTYARNIVLRDSVTLWKNVIEKFPAFEKGHAGLIESYYETERYEELTSALSNYPKDASEVRKHLKSRLHKESLELYKSGAYDSAIKKLAFALILSRPDSTGPTEDAGIHTDLGNAYMARGMVANAVTHYEEALKLDPNAPSTNNNLANAYYTLGNSEKAIYYYRAALTQNPDIPDVHFNLGMLYANTGKKKEASAEFESALRLAPDDAQARQELDKLDAR